MLFEGSCKVNSSVEGCHVVRGSYNAIQHDTDGEQRFREGQGQKRGEAGELGGRGRGPIIDCVARERAAVKAVFVKVKQQTNTVVALVESFSYSIDALRQVLGRQGNTAASYL